MPFVRDQEFAVAMAHVGTAPGADRLRPDLPSRVDVVLAQAMAKDREARYPSCTAFVEDLRTALGGGAVVARPVRTRAATPDAVLVAAVLGLGLVVVAGLALASGLLGGAGGASPSASAPSPSRRPQLPADHSPTPDPSIFPNTAAGAPGQDPRGPGIDLRPRCG